MSPSSPQPAVPSAGSSTVPSAPPSSSAPGSAPKPPPSSNLSISKTNASIQRINKLLSTTSRLDLTLGTLSYTLSFLSAILIPCHRRLHTARKGNGSRTLLILQSSKNLAALLAETRVTLRLVTGVVGIWPGLVAAFTLPSTPALSVPPPGKGKISSTEQRTEKLLKTLTRTSALSALVFQILENVAFLGDKGIFNIDKERRGKLWLYCSRAWCAGLVAELARLMIQGRMSNEEAGLEEDEADSRGKGEGDLVTTPENIALSDKYHEGVKMPTNEVGKVRQKKDTPSTQQAQHEERTRTLQITTLYLLMALHYSHPTGLMPETLVNLCGCVASWMGLAEAWRKVGT